jgi:pimeloyl-ACP methyl ester carboxylesterase
MSCTTWNCSISSGWNDFNIVGLSFGAYLAAKFASEHAHRLKKLVLIAPYGMAVEGQPMADILALPAETLIPMLVSNFEV